MSEKIKLTKHRLFNIIDALPNGSSISSVGSAYASGSRYGGYNDFYKESDNSYEETIHTCYGCSIIDVIEDLVIEAQDDSDGNQHDGIVIADNNGKIIHEWLPGTIEIDPNENIDDLKQRVAKRYINYALHDLVKAYDTVQYDNLSSDCEIRLEPHNIIAHNKDYNKYTLKENCIDIIKAESPIPLLRYLSSKLLALVEDKKEEL